MFFKEPNTDYAEFVYRWSDITKMGMSRFYPLIKTPPYLAAKPEIRRHQRTKDDRFLVMASDGLWGLKGVTDKWAVQKARHAVEKGLNPAEYMMAEVLKFRPGDDVTIVVIVFSTIAAKEPESEPQNFSST
jgi:serine/threonine protein phosphatase PrpC